MIALVLATLFAAEPLYRNDADATLELVEPVGPAVYGDGNAHILHTPATVYYRGSGGVSVIDRETGADVSYTYDHLQSAPQFGDSTTFATGVSADGLSVLTVSFQWGWVTQIIDGVQRDRFLLRAIDIVRIRDLEPPVVIKTLRASDLSPALAATLTDTLDDQRIGFRDFVVSGDDARLCGPSALGILCIQPDATPAVTLRFALDDITIDTRAVEETLAVDPQVGVVPPVDRWRLEDPIAGDGTGRLWFIATHTLALIDGQGVEHAAQEARFVVALDPDDTLRVLDGPSVGTQWDEGHLHDVTQLDYDAGLDALIAFPFLGHDLTDIDYASFGTTDTGHIATYGIGLRVIAPDGSGAGYLGFSDAIMRALRCWKNMDAHELEAYGAAGCEYSPIAPQLVTLVDGALAVKFQGEDVPEADYRTPHAVTARLVYDRDRLDLDEDHLDAAAERDLGTSDLSPDSDGGGTNDYIEAIIAGTDPNDPSDDPGRIARAATPHVAYAQSLDIRRHVPALANVQAQFVPTPGTVGPLCLASGCYSAGGERLVDFDGLTQSYPPVRSVDGRWAMILTPEGLVRVALDDGRRELMLPTATIAASVDLGRVGAIVPLDGERVYLMSAIDNQVVYFDGDDVRVVFDPEADRCASGLGSCDVRPAPQVVQHTGSGWAGHFTVPMPVEDVWSVRYLGFNATLGRLELFVQGALDAWWVGVDQDGPEVVMRGREMVGLGMTGELGPAREGVVPPAFLVASGHGDLVTDTFVREPHLSSIPTQLRAAAWDQTPFTAWGDTLLRGDAIGVSELVRYEEGLEPGDVLLAGMVQWPWDPGTRQTDAGFRTMLYRMGPRGGAVALWDMGRADIRAVRALAVAKAGWVALLEPGSDDTNAAYFQPRPSATLHLLGPIASRGGIPGANLGDWVMPDAIDVAFDRDSALITLHTDPPRIERRASAARPGDGRVQTTGLVAPAGGTRPELLVAMPDGSFEVEWRIDGYVRSRSYLDDGREAIVDPVGFTLDGVEGYPGALAYDGSIYSPRAGLDAPPMRITDRGQGDVLFNAGVGLHLPSGTKYVTAAVGDPAELGRYLVLAARVPGRTFTVDPWTGAPLRATVEPPAAPSLPAIDVAPADPDDDEGCGAGSPSLLALALFIAARRRRCATT